MSERSAKQVILRSADGLTRLTMVGWGSSPPPNRIEVPMRDYHRKHSLSVNELLPPPTPVRSRLYAPAGNFSSELGLEIWDEVL